jgi:hypothetical protein
MKHLVLIALIAAAGFLFFNDSKASIEAPNKKILNMYNKYLTKFGKIYTPEE